MKEITIFNSLLIAWFVLGAVVFIALFFVAAPYGRHARKGWGYAVGNKLGWVLMEAAAPIVFAVCWLIGDFKFTAVSLVFLVLWEAHYIHRAFIYPFTLRGAARRMPLSIVSFGFLFNLMNGYLNGRYIFAFSGGYANSWLADPRFIIGVMLFVAGVCYQPPGRPGAAQPAESRASPAIKYRTAGFTAGYPAPTTSAK